MAEKSKGKTEFAVAATTTIELLRDVDGNPPVAEQYTVGEQFTIEKVVTVGNKGFGKIKDKDCWVDLSKMVRI